MIVSARRRLRRLDDGASIHVPVDLWHDICLRGVTITLHENAHGVCLYWTYLEIGRIFVTFVS